jgi:hypothetical protein
MGRVHCHCRYHVCGGEEGAAGLGHAKHPPPPLGWRKAVHGPSPGGAPAEGQETSRFENETHLVAARLPGRAVTGLAWSLGW